MAILLGILVVIILLSGFLSWTIGTSSFWLGFGILILLTAIGIGAGVLVYKQICKDDDKFVERQKTTHKVSLWLLAFGAIDVIITWIFTYNSEEVVLVNPNSYSFPILETVVTPTFFGVVGVFLVILGVACYLAAHWDTNE